ncbi:MAG: HpcH/HpaI aldolase/citrate lyase family protein [Chloroflexota bacterium]
MNLPTIRTFLFVPGNRADMLRKAVATDADAIIPDLEDAVPDAEKAAARETVSGVLAELAQSGKPVVPRLNSLESGLLERDLAAVAGPHIAAVSVGKARGPGDVRRMAASIDVAERRAELRAGSIGLLPWIETARAVARAVDVCSASPRIRWVGFGAEDFSNDCGIPKDLGGWFGLAPDPAASPLLMHARAAVVTAAKGAGVAAIDTPYINYRDPDGLGAEARMARSMGFDGKFAIHPSQVDAINRMFSPTQEELDSAQRILAAAEEAEAKGHGSVGLEGRLIDRPTIERARTILRRAGRQA